MAIEIGTTVGGQGSVEPKTEDGKQLTVNC
jgi:hypothetical protein